MLTASGRATFTPSLLLPVLLLLIAAAALGVAWPVRASVRAGTRIDPFRALRAATLARASSLVGAIMAGLGGGLCGSCCRGQCSPGRIQAVAMLALIGGALVLVSRTLSRNSSALCQRTLMTQNPEIEPLNPTEGGDLAALDAGTYSTVRQPRNSARLELDGTWHQISPRYVVSQILQNVIFLVIILAAAARSLVPGTARPGCGFRLPSSS